MPLVKKAVITAAGFGTRHFPATRTIQKEMMPLVDRDGTTKPTLQIILEEARDSGIEEFCIVISPHSEAQIRAHFQGLAPEEREPYRTKPWALEQAERLDDLSRRITYAVQSAPEGYGDAVYRAREFVGDDPFLLLLGDHVFISHSKTPCSRQLIDAFSAHQSPISGVQRTNEELLHLFGTLTGRRISADPNVYEVSVMAEKPSLEFAEEHLRAPGLRRGEYLTFFGAHVLPPAIFDLIEHHIRNDLRVNGEIQLTNALDMLQQRARYLALEMDGERYDMGVPFGLIQTQIALAIHSPARRRVLACLPHLLTLSDFDSLR